MNSITKLTALITGATGGMGRELCREFARHGYNLVITSTKADKLETLAADISQRFSVKVYAFPVDLASKNGVKELFYGVRTAGIEVDVLINNAGFGLGGELFHQNTLARQQEMINVNASALTALCRAFIPSMLRRGGGSIINMASLGSFVPGPNNAVYCATKAYVLSLSEALSEELRDKGIAVTAICPGGTRTGFAHRANMETTPLFRYFVLDPRQVARETWRAYCEGKRTHIVGDITRAMVFATRLSPRRLTAKISGLIQRPAK